MLKRKIMEILCSQKTFRFCQKHGIHIMRKHFYSPVPDTAELALNCSLWEKQTDAAGVDMNIDRQLEMLEKVFPEFQHELDFPLYQTSVPHEYYITNGAFGFVSAAVLHCMIRHFQPRRILEVGSGNSTYVSARACLMNQQDGRTTELISIEPFPNQVLQNGFAGLSMLIPKKVEEAEMDIFDRLQEGDILFIDSSHVVRTGGDVVFLYLEVLPRLKQGVVIHIHDIFFPGQYPRDWVINKRRFWTEQYLLQAFLAFNSYFEILWSGSYMYARYLDKFKTGFPAPEQLGFKENYFSSSFWMQKRQ